MHAQAVASDVAIGMIGGYVGTKALEAVSMKLYELELEEDRRREDAVRPGDPAQIAAQEVTRWLGLRLAEDQMEQLGTLVFHYGLGVSWGPVYFVLRRVARLDPLSAGPVSGAAMSLLIDEGLTPALGFSAPNRAYPLVTHVRGFVAHLAFGLGVAATAELLYWLAGRWTTRR